MSRKAVRKTCILLIACIAIGSILIGCGSSNTQGIKQPADEKILLLAYDRDPDILDTIKSGWYSDALVYIHDRLVTRDYDYNFKPGLAESWEVSEDSLVWTFHLKEGVKFHDEKPFKAEDVKWTLDTIRDPSTASPYANYLESIKDVVIKDDYIVDIVLKYPFPNLLFNLSNTAVSIHQVDSYEKYGSDYGIKTVIGTGPYKFNEWVKGDKIVIEKNPDYNWGPEWMDNQGPALIDKIVMKTIPDENVRLMEIETGGIHILKDVPEIYVEKLEELDDIEIIKGDATKLGYLGYPIDKEPFNDIRVRRAINHAINREAILKYVFRGVGEVAYGYLPTALKIDYYEGTDDIAYKFDPERAKGLLAEAGYPNGLELTLSADNSSKSTKLAEVIQSQLNDIGIKVSIRLYDSSSYTAMLKEGKQELHICEYSWPNADILDWYLLSDRAPYPNTYGWLDEKTDNLIKAAGQAANLEERAELYKEVQKHLIENAVWCPIYIPNRIYAVRKEVVNFKFHPWMLMYSDGFDIEE